MDWWTSIVNGYKTVSDTVIGSMTWIRDTGTPLATRAISFTSNTFCQFAEQGLALRSAIPSLANDPATQKIAQGMFQIMLYDVLPVVGINYVNNGLQQYFRAGHEQDAWLAPYSMFLTTLTLVNYGVTAYTYRQGAQAVTRTLILESLAPAAFNAHTKANPSACSEEKCTTKRFLSGMLREPLILGANDLLTGVVSTIPYIGMPASQVLRMICIGRYITRLVTPERCERHKYMMPESVLALGIAHQASLSLVNATLEASVGLPPFLQHRTIQHMLTLLFVNLAAHMKLPLVKRNEANATIDFLNKYEQITRFCIDVIFAGLLKRIPIDFARDPETPPLVSIDQILRCGTRLFNGELVIWPHLGPINRLLQRHRAWMVPRFFNDPINDPIVTMYWPTIRSEAIAIISQIEAIHRNATVQVAKNYFPKTVANILFLTIGLPKKTTKLIIKFTQEEDFGPFIRALKLWFERNNIAYQVTLVRQNTIALHGRPLLLAPEHDDSPLIAANALIADTSYVEPYTLVTSEATTVVSAEQLVSLSEERLQPGANTTLEHANNPYLLFSSGTRQRRKTAGELQLDSADLFKPSK